MPSPRNGNSSFEAYAKPIMMFQPEETRVKQRQRLLSDELTKQPQPVNRPPTPPGKLQIGKISSMLQNDSAGGKPAADAGLSPQPDFSKALCKWPVRTSQRRCTEGLVAPTGQMQQRRGGGLS